MRHTHCARTRHALRPSCPMFAILLVTLPASLPRCVVAVAGANGRVGSMVCRELLRKHPQVTVRALVRTATEAYQGYGRLSYVVGAEDGKMEIKSAFRIDEDTGGVAAPAKLQFDPDVQAGYGLDRLEVRECELRFGRDVDAALGDADAVIWCASAFNEFRQRLPDRIDDAAGRVARAGMNLFELRLGKAFFGEEPRDEFEEQRRRAASEGTADVEGLKLCCEVLAREGRRRATLAELTGGTASALGAKLGVRLVVASASSALGYDEDPISKELRENEFGFRKRLGEAAVREAPIPSVIVRSAELDDVRGEEGLQVHTHDTYYLLRVHLKAPQQTQSSENTTYKFILDQLQPYSTTQ